MSFLYPLGLLGLIAVPVLIIIYIIKNKYTEQVISATYLWTLSEKFLKRKNPINRLTGIISLILQILAVIFLSFAIAHPVFALPGAANDFCFILDGSGSMNIVQNDRTRLDLGKDRIRSIVDGSANGSSYTLVYVGTTTDVLLDGVEDKERVLTVLDEITPDYCASGFADALVVAQKIFEDNPSVKTYLITDKYYETSGNVEIVTLSSHEENYSVADLAYEYSGGKLKVTGVAYSYESDVSLELGLYIDGATEPQSTQTVEVSRLEGAAFVFESDVTDFRSLRVAIAQSDALALDNESVLYNVKFDSTYRTLIVSETPFFLQAAFASVGNQVDTVTPENYANQSGYGLYVFDSFSPSSMPKDGAVWFVDPQSSVESAGFSVQSEVTLSAPGRLVYSTSSSTKVKNLIKGTVNDAIYVSEYVKCGLYRSFYTLLSYDGNPLLFAGTNAYGNREVVFAFGFHDSDFPLSFDYPVLINNLLSYTFPAVVDASTYYCGDTVQINVPANCDSIRVDTPLGNVKYIETGSDSVDYLVTEAGAYTITLIANGASKTVNLWADLPLSERMTTVNEQSFVLQGEPENVQRDGKYDDLIVLFIVLAVLFLADWMVYCYEQYQLR